MYSIRTATLADLDLVTKIEAVCFPPEQAATEDSFRARLAVFPNHFLLLEQDGCVVGFVNGAVIDTRYIEDVMYEDAGFHDKNGAYQSVYGLNVLPDHRGRGLAHKLMDALIERAREEGRKGVTLTCLREKIGFYETMGFHSEGVSDSSHGSTVWYNMLLDF